MQQKNIIKIFNLSTHLLSETEISLLSRDLSLCPTANMNTFNLLVDLNSLIRKLTLTRHCNINGKPSYFPNTTTSSATATDVPPIHTDVHQNLSSIPLRAKVSH